MVNKQKQIKSKEKKICFRCKNIIIPKARHVELITKDNEKIIEAIYFHISCWGEYNSDKVNQRIKEMAAYGLKSIQPMLEQLGGNLKFQ